MVIWSVPVNFAEADETNVPVPKQPLYPSIAADDGVAEAAEAEAPDLLALALTLALLEAEAEGEAVGAVLPA